MPQPDRGGPLKGVRVLAVTKVWAGPYAGKYLAHLGAEPEDLALDRGRNFNRRLVGHNRAEDRVLAHQIADLHVPLDEFGLGHAFGLSVVAEGVETADQLQELRALGCDVGQGYLFSPPQTGARARTILDQGFEDRVQPDYYVRMLED